MASCLLIKVFLCFGASKKYCQLAIILCFVPSIRLDNNKCYSFLKQSIICAPFLVLSPLGLGCRENTFWEVSKTFSSICLGKKQQRCSNLFPKYLCSAKLFENHTTKNMFISKRILKYPHVSHIMLF